MSRRVFSLLLPVYVPSFLLAFTQGLLIPTLPLYATTFGVSFSLISLAVAARGLGTLAMDLPSGIMLERLGPSQRHAAGRGRGVPIPGAHGNHRELPRARLASVTLRMWRGNVDALAHGLYLGRNPLGSARKGLVGVWRREPDRCICQPCDWRLCGSEFRSAHALPAGGGAGGRSPCHCAPVRA